MRIKAIAVFCGSKEGNNKTYIEHATLIGKLLADNNITLIYGGGGYGIMGAVASACLKYNGKVIGVIPKVLTDWEKQHTSLTELHEVENMHVRKRMIYEKSDAAIILPGGYGTLDEMFEIITWNQLKIHNKKIIVLNSDGFYIHLIKHLEMMQEQGFLYESFLERIVVINSPEELLQHLSN